MKKIDDICDVASLRDTVASSDKGMTRGDVVRFLRCILDQSWCDLVPACSEYGSIPTFGEDDGLYTIKINVPGSPEMWKTACSVPFSEWTKPQHSDTVAIPLTNATLSTSGASIIVSVPTGCPDVGESLVDAIRHAGFDIPVSRLSPAGGRSSK